MNKKGFTLIELLAVIIILGILMIIAIPSVTKYINDSRKSSYIDTAKELVGAARNLVNDGKLEMYDTDATYYIDIACLKTENGGKAVSPYGDFVKEKAYVVVTFDGKGYEYFWTSIDDSGQGIKDLIKYDKLDIDNIESDLKSDDIKTDRGIDGRSEVILITERNKCQKEGVIGANSQVNGETGEEIIITYPAGKDKSSVVMGDIVKIKTEEFYVVSNNGTDLVLLSHYNLKVGKMIKPSSAVIGEYTSSDSGYGLQSSEATGYIEGLSAYNGILGFSRTNYWNEKVGTVYPGNYCTSVSDSNCAYVYDSNSNHYTYIENYAKLLGIEVKSARVLSLDEYKSIVNAGKRSILEGYSFGLGNAYSFNLILCFANNTLTHCFYNNARSIGVRPVIVI